MIAGNSVSSRSSVGDAKVDSGKVEGRDSWK